MKIIYIALFQCSSKQSISTATLIPRPSQLPDKYSVQLPVRRSNTRYPVLLIEVPTSVNEEKCSTFLSQGHYATGEPGTFRSPYRRLSLNHSTTAPTSITKG